MSFRVSKWPYSPDPRPPDYAITGFDFGEVPPWRWVAKTTGALPPYEALNDGVTWENDVFDATFALYLPVNPIAGVTDPLLGHFGTQEPVDGHTVEWLLSFFTTGADAATIGELDELYPVAIAERSFTMVNVNAPPPYFPNPLVLTPHLWNAE